MIDIPLDENGEFIVYPNPLATEKKPKKVSIGEIHLSTIKTILTSCKPALATTMETPVYTNYYAGDTVIATDTNYGSDIDR